MHVDVAVLGAGPGGYVAAIRAAQLGKSVAVIETQHWGGVCLNLGCVPCRSLLRNAEIAHVVNHKAELFGISGEVTVAYRSAFERSRRVSEARVKGVHFLMRKNGISEISGWGTFGDDHCIEVTLRSGGSETVTFDNAIIATGSTVRTLPGIDLGANVVTYEPHVLARELPGSIAIVGAGAIGMEFAFLHNSFGADVTLIEIADRLLPAEDVEVSREIARQYRKMGITVLTSTRTVSAVDDGQAVTLGYEPAPRAGASESVAGSSGTLRVDKVLVSVGFAPRTAGFGLENTGVTLTDGGAIAIDEGMRTSVPHLFAVGDVTAKLARAHVAEAQGVIAAETIAGAETMTLGDYRMLPRATFCQPQIASFGLTEQQARDEGHDVRVAKFPLTANARAQSLGDPSGFAKLIADADLGELLGAHLIGPDVSELLPELTLAQKWDLGAAELARNIHVHPTMSEALQESFHGLLGHMINL